MGKLQRIKNVMIGILTILCGVLIMLYPDTGYLVMLSFLSLALIISGLRYLGYYFTMARFMVGGKAMLFIGMITLDVGMFTFTMFDLPRAYVLFYLLLYHAFTGLIDILRGLEARRLGSSWRLKVIHGAVNIVIALFCIIFVRSLNVLVYIYGLGLIYSAVIRISTAFRKTAIVYIQ